MATPPSNTEQYSKPRMPYSMQQVHNDIKEHPDYSLVPEKIRFVFENCVVNGFDSNSKLSKRYARDLWKELYEKNKYERDFSDLS